MKRGLAKRTKTYGASGYRYIKRVDSSTAGGNKRRGFRKERDT